MTSLRIACVALLAIGACSSSTDGPTPVDTNAGKVAIEAGYRFVF